MLEAVSAVPGVTAVTRVNAMPGTGNGGTQRFLRTDRPAPSGAQPEATVRTVEPSYFRVLGIPLLGGRAFGPEDTQKSVQVVIVNRRLQRLFFPGEDAVGKRIHPTYAADAPVLTIVGVVADQTFGALDEPAPSILYYPDTQIHREPGHLRPPLEPGRRGQRRSAGRSRRRCRRSRCSRCARSPRCWTRRHRCSSAATRCSCSASSPGSPSCSPRWASSASSPTGSSQRTREFGVRMAVGADRRDIVRLVLRRNLPPVLAGAVAGVLGSVVLAVVFRGLLFGVSASDPAVLAAVVAVLALVAVGSALLPALRASRVDPATALRST